MAASRSLLRKQACGAVGHRAIRGQGERPAVRALPAGAHCADCPCFFVETGFRPGQAAMGTCMSRPPDTRLAEVIDAMHQLRTQVCPFLASGIPWRSVVFSLFFCLRSVILKQTAMISHRVSYVFMYLFISLFALCFFHRPWLCNRSRLP